MGTLKDLHRNRGFRQGRVNRNPLRKIVGEENGLEVLECGHKQVPVYDFIGRTNAVHRRCWQCGKPKPQYLTPHQAWFGKIDSGDLIHEMLSPLEIKNQLFEIVAVNPQQLANLRPDHADISPLQAFEEFAELWQKKLVQRYVKQAKELAETTYLIIDSELKIIVDGHHRLIAFYQSGLVTANAIDLAKPKP